MTLKIAQEQELLQQNPDITNHTLPDFLFIISGFHYRDYYDESFIMYGRLGCLISYTIGRKIEASVKAPNPIQKFLCDITNPLGSVLGCQFVRRL